MTGRYARAALVRPAPPKPNEFLCRLRREFPHFGIVVDTRRGVWMAVRGRDLVIRASDGIVLRERLLSVSRGGS